MSDIFKHVPWTVEELVSAIDKGAVRLPDIQRPFVWQNAKVRDLMDSMYRGFPVGELMFWVNRDLDHARVIGVAEKDVEVTRQIIDGQQRLTSLYAVVKGLPVWRDDYSRETIKVAFNPCTERFEVPNRAIEQSSEWILDIESIFDDPIQARDDYLDRLQASQGGNLDRETKKTIEKAIQRLDRLTKYHFQVVELQEEVGRERVSDIFVRINSEGVNLSSADFILTWMSVFWESGRSELETWARDSRFTPAEVASILREKKSWTPRNPYMDFSPGQILRVVIAVGQRRARLQDAYNYLRGRNPRTRVIEPELREKALVELKNGQKHSVNPLHWDEFIKVLERAGFRTAAMISSKNTILYSYALWMIGRVDFEVPVDELRESMARWFFMSQLTGRYTSSPETRMQEDLNRLAGLDVTPEAFVRVLNSQIDAAVPEDWWRVTLVDSLNTSSTTAPSWTAYIAALNILDADVLLATSKVKDWINPMRETIKGIEKHHLFPREYLRSVLGIDDTKKINQVANYALVEWSDNIEIAAQSPAAYWAALVTEKSLDEPRRVRQEEWHALPDGWTELDYNAFLDQRRKLMSKVIHEGFKRLTDPNYEPDLTRPELLPTEAELPTFEALFNRGFVKPRTPLLPADPNVPVTAEITEDGFIKVGERLYDTPDQAAAATLPDAGSGWEFWQLDGHNGEAITLAAFRRQAVTTAS